MTPPASLIFFLFATALYFARQSTAGVMLHILFALGATLTCCCHAAAAALLHANHSGFTLNGRAHPTCFNIYKHTGIIGGGGEPRSLELFTCLPPPKNAPMGTKSKEARGSHSHSSHKSLALHAHSSLVFASSCL